MTILYISDRFKINQSEAFQWFQPFCEFNDLYLYTKFDEAKEFLINSIINQQKHIDFIITDWIVQLQNAKSFLNWLKDSNETYSSQNFQLKSIPILLIEDSNYQSSEIEKGFNGLVSDFPTNRSKLIATVKSTVREWRYALACELDLIGLDPKSLKNYPNHRSSFISYYRLNILTRNFVDIKSKKLNYIWTISDYRMMDEANEQFLHKMNRANTNPSKYQEKEFHTFFNNNKTFLLGEGFSHFIYEPHLYKNGSRSYDEPDFINSPNEHALRMPEVFEVKRQSQRFIRRHNNNFLSKARKSFEQVKRYKEYMNSNDPRNQHYVKKHLGKIYSSYEYTLLMGSKSEKEGYMDIINRLKDEFEFADINLITYEELLDKHVRLCNRLNEFNIFD